MRISRTTFTRCFATPRFRRILFLGLGPVLFLAALPGFAAVNTAWSQRYDSIYHGYDYSQACAVDKNGDVVVTGYAADANRDTGAYTAKYAGTTGALLWAVRYNQANRTIEPNGLAVDALGNVAIVTTAGATNGMDIYTAKYASTNGALMWEHRYSSPGVYVERHGEAVAVDGGGNVIISGYCYFCAGYGADIITVKYAANTGQILWENYYNGPANSHDYVEAVTVDALGNAIVAGYSANATNQDFYVAKHAAASGGTLWNRRYNGPANQPDYARAVAVDGAGNVVATGDSHNGVDRDYYTAKYAAASGALLWERRYDGPAHSNDLGRAIAVDAGGNVFVTGSSQVGNHLDIYTAKYAATNGAVLWERRYNGPASGSDIGRKIVVTPEGDAVVTGSSQGDFYTVKYAGAEGAVLWERRDTAAFGTSTPTGLALGSNGTVAVTGSTKGQFDNSDYLTFLYREPLAPVRIATELSGVRLRFQATAGRSYGIESAPTPAGPWSTNAILAAVTNGVLEHLVTNAPPGSAFYRTSAGP